MQYLCLIGVKRPCVLNSKRNRLTRYILSFVQRGPFIWEWPFETPKRKHLSPALNAYCCREHVARAKTYTNRLNLTNVKWLLPVLERISDLPVSKEQKTLINYQTACPKKKPDTSKVALKLGGIFKVAKTKQQAGHERNRTTPSQLRAGFSSASGQNKTS